MLSAELAAAIGAAIAAAEGGQFTIAQLQPVAGGSIARNLCVADGGRRFFVKLQPPDLARFEAERDGLLALARCPQLVVPRVVASGLADGAAFLVLEWLEFDASGSDQRLAEAIATLHGIGFPRYGWHCDNWIGATPQANGWRDDWAGFFVDRRLRPQIAAVGRHGFGALQRAAEAALPGIARGLAGYRPPAGLLHGDLWSGNVGFVRGRPALFDPAVYAGDGETDLAMAALFGGFSRRFFAAYAALRPGDGGAGWRRRIYQLYHLLNHVNLFGASYLAQAGELLRDLGRPAADRLD